MLKYLFAAPEDYSQMLWKIATSTGIVTFACLLVLAQLDTAVNSALFGPGAVHIQVLGVSLPIVPVVVSAIVALVTRAFKLHDRVSDVFGIRRRFDLREIIGPLAVESGLTWDGDRYARARAERDKIMRRTFYRYASSTNPVIDKHLIITALDKWSWFWIVVEALVLLALSAGFLFWRQHIAAALGTCIVIGIFALLAIATELGCRHNAEAQLDEILRDKTRRDEIREELNALLG